MEKFYDKILFVLAAALLGVGVLMFLKQDNLVKASLSSPENTYPYSSISTPPQDVFKAEWLEAGPQSAGEDWVFQVFTPPKIWVDANGQFTAESPDVKIIPFGIRLAGIERPLYRFQFISFLGSEQNPILVVKDLERNREMRVRLKKKNAFFDVISFDVNKVSRVNEGGGTIVETTPTLVIFDKSLGRQVELIQKQSRYAEDYVVTLENTQRKEQFTCTESGYSFSANDAKYVVVSIDVAAQSVVISKDYQDAKERPRSETKLLTLTE